MVPAIAVPIDDPRLDALRDRPEISPWRFSGKADCTTLTEGVSMTPTPRPIRNTPGLFLIGLGVGVMLTPSVNVVQSAFPENLQGEISGLSRSASNLGSSIGTAIAGTILVAGLADAGRSYGIAMVVLAFIGLIGLGAAVMLPKTQPSPETDTLGTTVGQRL